MAEQPEGTARCTEISKLVFLRAFKAISVSMATLYLPGVLPGRK